MSALYAMNYVGQTGTGGGAVYVGNGKIVGIDVGNLRYNGTYTEQAGRLKGSVMLSAPNGGNAGNWCSASGWQQIEPYA
jgi:hypothetical protein